MPNFSQNSNDFCVFCTLQDTPQVHEIRKCNKCREKGDVVGEIIHGYIKRSTQEIRDDNRVIFMLVGFSPVYLEGLVRKLPALVNNKSIHLRINPDVSDKIEIAEEYLSNESSTHWRHYDDADIIIFAPPDSEINSIGSSLGSISVIDENLIVGEIDNWVKVLGAPELQSNYLESALTGLKNSNVYIDLDRWVDFVLAIKRQGFDDTVDTRLNKAAPALHLPIFGITDLPRYNLDQTPNENKFQIAFEVAKNQVGVYVGLFTQKNERVVIEDVQEAIENFDENNDPKLIASIEAAQNLINDATKIRPGTWLQSQKDFCEKVNWSEVGAKIFTGNNKPRATNIGEQTLNYLRGNFQDKLTPEEEEYLTIMGNGSFTPNPEFEARFFEKWKENLYRAPSIRLFRSWQGRVFRKEVSGQDLLILMLDGFESLFKTGFLELEDMDDPGILVRSSHPNKADYWEGKDSKVLKLFQFELASVINHLQNKVKFDLNECFDTQHNKPVSTKEGRSVELELYLVEKSDLSKEQEKKRILNSAPRVKATWQPGREIKLEPITLSLVQDIEDLEQARIHKLGFFSNNKFTPVEGSISPTTLHDRNTFDDVTGHRSGRIFEISEDKSQDLVHSIKLELNKYLEDQLVSESVVQEISASLENFLNHYSDAIKDISGDFKVSKGFGSPSIMAQAYAFGEFCKSCRNQNLNYNLKRKVQSYVARIGTVFSEENIAIITPWHPFRLAEKYNKILALSEFLAEVLASSQKSDISMEFSDLRKKLLDWHFPEVAFYEDSTLITIESLGGYSLLALADCEARSQEALEISARDAANYFSKAVDQYLDIHPHEVSNLSISIFNSESESLPGKVSDLLAAKFHSDHDLRCDLIISHFDQDRLQEIYRNQNSILSTGEIGDNVKAILTRLRVDVRSHRQNSSSDEVRDLDILFLHESISKFSHNSWEISPYVAPKNSKYFHLSNVDASRRMITEDGIHNSIIYQTSPQPPEAVTEYHGLLYELDRRVNLPEGNRAIYLNRINGNGPEIKQLIDESHALSNWVVTYDKSISRSVLEQSNVKIIQDITTPGAEGRVIISASKIEEELEANLKNKITNTCQISSEESQEIANFMLNDVMNIAGQKLLAAIRNENIINEILGLSLLKSRLLASLPENSTPIWISLDEYRSWITSGKGKFADLLGISVCKKENGFHIYLQVGEAKFISKYNLSNEIKDAQKQVELTLEHLSRSLIDNENLINLKSWCAMLEKLIITQEFQFNKIGGYKFRSQFIESLRNANVTFHICGDSVICLHDDDEGDSCINDSAKPYLRKQVISRYKIKSLLKQIIKGQPSMDPELMNIIWYSRKESPPPPPKPLKDELTNYIRGKYLINLEESRQIADFVIDDVNKIVAIQNEEDSKIKLGLSLLKSRLHASLPENFNPIWISLNGRPDLITSDNDKNADLLGLSVDKTKNRFRVYLQVGKIKYINSDNISNEVRDAEIRTELTVKNFKNCFIDHENDNNIKSWCDKLESLILSQDIPLNKIGGEDFRSQFLDSLRRGNIKFHICGDTLICLPDSETGDLLKYDTSKEYLRTQRISKNTIKSLLQMNALGNIPFDPELQDIKWYPKDYDKVPCPPPPGPQPDEHFLPEHISKAWQLLANNSSEDIIDENSFKWAEEECIRTQKALSDFNIEAKFEEEENRYKLTPNGVLISFRGNRTLTVKSIESKKSELLTTYGLDVSDIRPGKGKVSLYIKREKRAQLPLASSLLRFLPESRQGSFFNFLIGILEDDDRFIPLNLYREYKGFEEHAPHTLIAGETGSGKGVLIQNLILQMITFNNPNNLELYLIDPKMGVDFHWVKDSPHIKDQIISDPQEATQLLGTLVAEMDRRYRKFVEMKVNDLETYNSKVDPKIKLPRIILVHDEMGSWMVENDDYKKVVLTTASNLGMKARAAGIHLILITQRADKDAIPPKLRDNLGNRLCLKVNSKGGSEIVLQCLGAEKLLGKGHIACNLGNQTLPPGQEYFVAQVPFAEQNQIEILAKAAIDYWKDRAPIIVPTDEPPIISSPSGTVYKLKLGGINALMKEINGRFFVLEGSSAIIEEKESLSKGNRDFRLKLSIGKIWEKSEDGTNFQFKKNVEFSSKSHAACVILGYSANGQICWQKVN